MEKGAQYLRGKSSFHFSKVWRMCERRLKSQIETGLASEVENCVLRCSNGPGEVCKQGNGIIRPELKEANLGTVSGTDWQGRGMNTKSNSRHVPGEKTFSA